MIKKTTVDSPRRYRGLLVGEATELRKERGDASARNGTTKGIIPWIRYRFMKSISKIKKLRKSFRLYKLAFRTYSSKE